MYLGIDLGTSSLKILLADENGKIIDKESADYPLSFPKEGWCEQNAEDWALALFKTLGEMGKRRDLKEIKALSFSGQMHGLVILDEDDKLIRPVIMWNDNRTKEECGYLNNVIGKEKLLEWTGNIAYPGFTAPKLLWLKKHEPENFKRIKKIMVPKDYLAYILSGVFAGDVSDDSGTLYFDVKNKRWSKEMLEVIGITEAQLPKIFESFQAVGTVKEDMSKRTGLLKDAKVVIGGGDQAVGGVGTGTVGKGKLSISLGTSGVLFASASEFAFEKNGGLHAFCHADGNYHFMGVTLSAAGSLNWWANDIVREKDFDKLLKDLPSSKAENLIFFPYLMGERSPINDPDIRGAFFGLTLSHNREDMTRAVIEGITFGLYDNFLAIKDLGIEIKSARIIGGGAKSASWLQIIADVLGIELKTINTSEGGGLGAVILAMVGDGKYKTVKAACEAIIREEKTFIPDMEKHSLYDEKFRKFKRYYKLIKEE